MERILHQLIGSLSHDLQGFVHPSLEHPGPGMFLRNNPGPDQLIVDFIIHHHLGNGKKYEKVFRFNIRLFHGFWISKR